MYMRSVVHPRVSPHSDQLSSSPLVPEVTTACLQWVDTNAISRRLHLGAHTRNLDIFADRYRTTQRR
ncbi:hypothetical protein B0H12DRAFT_1138747 [Mycena haematopus]|nr:hypothetical protein B0H12DRAFT_1138747 [Mycena haematopus]